MTEECVGHVILKHTFTQLIPIAQNAFVCACVCACVCVCVCVYVCLNVCFLFSSVQMDSTINNVEGCALGNRVELKQPGGQFCSR